MVKAVGVVLAVLMLGSAGTMEAQGAPGQAAVAGQAAVQGIPGEGGNDHGFDMAPETTLEVVQDAVKMIPVKMAPGPFQPTWESLRANYRAPVWYRGAKFGIFMHFGIFSVPAHKNEWYEKYMYAGGSDSTLKDMKATAGGVPDWHAEHFGSPEKFGYKDFIPMFKAEKFDAEAWAELFKRAGAQFVMPGAQHHENFAMWDSQVTPFNSVKMGPHLDFIRQMAKAVRKRGMKLGIANHGIENYQFINPPEAVLAEMKETHADLADPKWADFYNVVGRSDARLQAFLVNWYQRNVELIDKYQPDLLYFDNGIDQRYLDPLKLQVAAYYYNRAKGWGKEVSLTTKKASYAPSGKNTEMIGSIVDFEGRTPPGIRTGLWQEDKPIGSTWGYTDGMHVDGPGTVLNTLCDVVSKNGTLLLNVSPMADGTIPQAQQDTLLAVGKWLGVNGEAIYDTHAWVKPNESGKPKIYFTVKGETLYAIVMGKGAAEEVLISSVAGVEGKVRAVGLLGGKGELAFEQEAGGLRVKLPAGATGDLPYVLKITGLKMNRETWTESGDPMAAGK